MPPRGILAYDKLLATAEARLSRLLILVDKLGELKVTQSTYKKLERARGRVRDTERRIQELTQLRRNAIAVIDQFADVEPRGRRGVND
jgi:hypothetical protein